ncbi:MAG: hypothetical protein H6505_04645 [Calditrichaeota bacterium]|nr:hypothetical protein [Calditrichota bacterium]
MLALQVMCWSHRAAASTFDVYGTDAGLSQSTVHCVMQDSRGYLWIGTDDGLNRYDGTDFTQYYSDPSDTLTLSNNGVWSLLEDRDGNIWIGTQKSGLNRLDRSTGRVEQVLDSTTQSELHGDAVIALLETSDGNIWAGSTTSGIILYSPKTREARNLSVKSGTLLSDQIRCLAEWEGGKLLVGTSNAGLMVLDPKTNTTLPIRHDAAGDAFRKVQGIQIDSLGTIWVATLDMGVLSGVITRRGDEYQSFFHRVNEISSGRIRAITVDRNQKVWAASASEGLFRYDPVTSSAMQLLKNGQAKNSLPENALLCLTVDRLGDLWIGTWSSGLARLQLRYTPFHVAEIAGPGASADETPAILSVLELPDGEILVGSVGQGLYRSSGSGNTSDAWRKLSAPELNDATIATIAPIADDRLLLGTYGAGAYWLNPRTEAVQSIELPDSLGITSILCSCLDHTGAVWFGTVNQGVICLNSEGKVLAHLNKNSSPMSLSNGIIYTLFEDSEGSLWIGTLDGLDQLSRDRKSLKSFTYSRSTPNTIPNNEIRALSEDANGNLWIGTSNGLARLSEDRETISRYTQNSGLANNVIYGLLVDKGNDVWVSTNRGLSVVRTDGSSVDNFYAWDGLPPGEFNQAACAKLRSGVLAFGGSSFFLTFEPDSARPLRVPVVVTAVRDYSTGEYLAREPAADASLVLDVSHKSISIEYSAVEFYGGVLRGFEHRMTPITTQWIRNASGNSAAFTNLDPGSYVFAVKRDGSDSLDATHLHIVIEPPWWQTRAAVMFWVFTGICLSIAVMLVVARAAKRREQKRVETEIFRTHFLDALSIFGHRQVVKMAFNRLEWAAKRLSDDEDSAAPGNFSKEVTAFRNEIAPKVEDLLSKLQLANLPRELEHEFRGAATDVNTIVRSLEQNGPAVPAEREAVQLAASINRLKNANESILEYLKTIYPTDLSAVVNTVIGQKHSVFDGNEISVQVALHRSVHCLIDRSELAAVLDDLISNAVDAMRTAPNKVLSIYSAPYLDDQVLLYVQDSGIGIPEDKWDTIFELGYTTKQTGTGFGLYNARKTLHRYQGELTIDASVPGTGTTLKLRLYLTEERHD